MRFKLSFHNLVLLILCIPEKILVGTVMNKEICIALRTDIAACSEHPGASGSGKQNKSTLPSAPTEPPAHTPSVSRSDRGFRSVLQNLPTRSAYEEVPHSFLAW